LTQINDRSAHSGQFAYALGFRRAIRGGDVKSVSILYFSDALCIWAHIAELRVAEVKRVFGDNVRIEHRFCSVFGDTAHKMATTWREKGGYEGFNAHLVHAAEAFPEITVNPEIWLSVRPASSTSAHLFLKAAHLDELAGRCAPGTTEAMLRAVRCAFFEDGRDIADWEVLRDLGQRSGADVARIEALIRNGAAFAALATDYHDAATIGVIGSPTFVFNEGRQKLYGNVGYRIIEANVQELLRTPQAGQASWC
jgi:predicted DsbA family dithiol-disulfide isomerase